MVWPAPPWLQRACTRDTLSCSSHGACSTAGSCVCDPQYYRSSSGLPCDTYCDGELSLTSGMCHSNRVFYVGGLVDFASSDKDEIISTMEFAVSLINNHSDGWFDDTRQVTLVLKVADSACSASGGEIAARLLNDWALESSEGVHTVDGLVGAFCSDSSIGSARFGNTIYSSQISYASTATSLADKDEYIYFARTCFADESQGELLVDMLEDVGLTPFISVISTTDSYARSLSTSIMENYLSKGHTILLSYSYTPPVNNTDHIYTLILDKIAASGAPVTVLAMYTDEVAKFMVAAAGHPVFQHDAMVWVGIEVWVGLNGPWNKPGMLGLMPYAPSANVTNSYMERWAALDPSAFIDTDGDRKSLASNTLFVADAVFALALAFQEVTGDESGADGDALKRQAFAKLLDKVVFTGQMRLLDVVHDSLVSRI